MTYREKALLEALQELGVTEQPAGSNWGPRVSQYLKSAGLSFPAPWCMAFVNWSYRQAGLDLEHPNEASVGFFLDWGRRNGWVVEKPVPGDIVCYQFTSDNWPDHVGIVKDVGVGRIVAVEGNTAYGDDANGGKVMLRSRSTSRCAFVRIPGESAAENLKRRRALRNWILRQRLLGRSWAWIKSTPNWREFLRRGGK